MTESSIGIRSERSGPAGETAARRTLPARRRIAYSAICLLGGLLLLEGVARLIVPSTASGRFQQINQIVLFLGTKPSDLMLDFDSERFWKLRPDVEIKDSKNTFWQGTVSNSLGFRSPEFELQKPPNTIRVVCFGDSSTFGIGAAMEDTWPSQLQELLHASHGANVFNESSSAPAIEVINAGVPGYTSHQGLQHMRQELDRLKPDIVMASYANNDFWHWDDQTDEEHAVSLSAVDPLHLLITNSRLVQLIANLTGSEEERTSGTGAASPNQHWAKAATVNYQNPREEWTRRVPLESFRRNIESMADLCEDRQLPLVLVKWPDQPQASGHWSPRMEYQEVLDETAARRGLAVADVVSMFQANRSWSVGTYVPNDIVHVNRDGNRLAAAAARDAIHSLVPTDSWLTN